MRAREVLSSYATGNRTFRNANLRGANFRRQDLSGADIRGANFIGATLWEVNFANAQVGLQHRYTFVCWALILFSSILSGLFQSLLSFYIDYALVCESTEAAVTGCIYILFVIPSYYAAGKQGFTGEALTWILAALSLSFVGVSVFAEIGQVTRFRFLAVAQHTQGHHTRTR